MRKAQFLIESFSPSQATTYMFEDLSDPTNFFLNEVYPLFGRLFRKTANTFSFNIKSADTKDRYDYKPIADILLAPQQDQDKSFYLRIIFDDQTSLYLVFILSFSKGEVRKAAKYKSSESAAIDAEKLNELCSDLLASVSSTLPSAGV